MYSLGQKAQPRDWHSSAYSRRIGDYCVFCVKSFLLSFGILSVITPEIDPREHPPLPFSTQTKFEDSNMMTRTLLPQSFKSKRSWMAIFTGLSILSLPQLATARPPEFQEEPQLIAQVTEEISPNFSSNGLFSIDAGKQLFNEGRNAVGSNNYDLAATKFKDARQLMNQLSNFYQGLASTFSGVDTVVSQSLRNQALETAELRDSSTYQLALVYRAQNLPDKAIPLLIEIVRSQNPSRQLGQQAYRQLFELGFVDTPYPRTQTTGQTP